MNNLQKQYGWTTKTESKLEKPYIKEYVGVIPFI